MKIVPETVRVFVVAFHESSPLVPASSCSTVCEATWLAADVPLTPRVIVRVVDLCPPVTVISSSSILTRKFPLVGKPPAEATVVAVWAEVIAEPRVVVDPLQRRHVGRVEGV